MLRILVLVSAMAVGFLDQPASACSCAELEPVPEALSAATAVFAGRVLALRLEEVPDPVLGTAEEAVVTLEVSKAWKGIDAASVEVRTSWTCCLCGFGFHLGEEYLVFATTIEDKLLVSACSHTERLQEAREAVHVLEGEFPLAYGIRGHD